jgi:GT2 family glycosyltransferase
MLSSISVVVVLYRPKLSQLAELCLSLAREQQSGCELKLFVWINDEETLASEEIRALLANTRSQGLAVTQLGDGKNIGFGAGVNAASKSVDTEYFLVLNQDAILEPNSLRELVASIETSPSEVAAWELRQIPFEHPKAYDPVSMDTEWFSGAAFAIRTAQFNEVGGFESRIFMYGEDVDLSWRLRCAGYQLRYVPRAAVVHHTYEVADEVKPLQALGGIYANLCLRTRYSGHRRILQGLAMAFGELMMPSSFPGRRRGVARAIVKFVRNYRYFWRTRCASPEFEPRFAGWGYEIRRDGAFHVFKTHGEKPTTLPLVSVLIRTHRRPAFLREALATVANQTYRPIEVIVIEDGSDDAREVCKEFQDRLSIEYVRLDPGRGRSAAGNVAMTKAHGDWFCFLDDDDVFFADHVEVLVDAVTTHKVRGAYSLAWRTATEILDGDVPRYVEHSLERIPDEPFSRVTLWHHNFMPIQAVLFHRSLYERYGGFAEDMDQLEDWNLWTRYTLTDDFVQVRKLTSKYRVPAHLQVNAERQSKLDLAYAEAIRRQGELKFEATPQAVRELAEAYAKSNALLHISRDSVRRKLSGSSLLSRFFAMRRELIVRFHRRS